jgi:hypothetical protein
MQYTPQSFKMRYIILAGALLMHSASFLHAMTVDQRFLPPFIERNPLLGEHKTCAFSFQPYLLLANKSYDSHGEEAALFAYDENTYGLRYLDEAVLASARRESSLIKTEWQRQLFEGPYVMRGRMTGQGAIVNAYFSPCDCFGFGVRSGLLAIESSMELVRDASKFEGIVHGLGDEQELIALQGRLHEALDVSSLCWQGTGFLDTELFVRAYFDHDYAYMCRYFSLGTELGLVVPTGRKRDCINPASLPFGGVGFGMYAEVSAEVLLKRDIWLFCFARAQKRFSGALVDERMSIGREPWRFGALSGRLSIDPGFTFAIAPWLIFEGMRDGLGFRVGYTLVSHGKDSIVLADWAPETAKKTPALDLYKTASVWGSECMHVGILYDYSRGKRVRSWEPVLAATVDIPTSWFVRKSSYKTFGISVSLESSF